jgi:hypothetical protein
MRKALPAMKQRSQREKKLLEAALELGSDADAPIDHSISTLMKTIPVLSVCLGVLLAAMNLTCAHGAEALDTWGLLRRGGPSLRDVEQRGGLLIAVGGAVLTSPDELNWTSLTVQRTGYWEAGPYSVPVGCREVKRIGDRFVIRGTCTVPDAIGQGAGEGVFASSEDGLNWDVTTAYYQGVYGGGWLRLTGGSGLLLAVGGMSRTMEDYGLASATSDGIT